MHSEEHTPPLPLLGRRARTEYSAVMMKKKTRLAENRGQKYGRGRGKMQKRA
jgi:hypothetical protein